MFWLWQVGICATVWCFYGSLQLRSFNSAQECRTLTVSSILCTSFLSFSIYIRHHLNKSCSVRGFTPEENSLISQRHISSCLVSCTVAFLVITYWSQYLPFPSHSCSSDVVSVVCLSLPRGLNGEVEGAQGPFRFFYQRQRRWRRQTGRGKNVRKRVDRDGRG